MSSATASPRLTPDQVDELLPLLDGCDTVELKTTVPATGHRSAIARLGLDPLGAQVRQVFFFDTPDLTCFEHGLVARARRIQGKGDDSVVKLRPVVPSELPAKLRAQDGFGVEVDAMPGGFVCSASLKGVPPAEVRATLEAGRPLRKLFTKAQRRLFAEHAPDGVDLDDLTVLGPVFVLKLRFTPPELGRRLVAEAWLYPDESRILELSTKCLPGEAFDVAVRVRAHLARCGVEIADKPETKTRRALEVLTAAAAATD